MLRVIPELMIAEHMISPLVIAPVPVLDLRHLKLDRVRIAKRRQSVDDRSSRIPQSQQLRDFIERLSAGVIASVPDVPVGPEIFLHLGKIKMRVPARDHQRQHRKMQVCHFRFAARSSNTA